jgi:hypothetical protein
MDDDAAVEPEMTVIEWFDALDDANQAAAALVEHGVGAILETGSPPRTGLAVLADDAAWARQVLGLEAEGNASDSDELRRMSRGWLVPVLVFGLVLILLPLLAFFVSFKLSGG